jgi:hypothetical protein
MRKHVTCFGELGEIHVFVVAVVSNNNEAIIS